jgi:hypothetical protein
VHRSGREETFWYNNPGDVPVSGKTPKNFPSSSCAIFSPFIPSPSVFRTLGDEPPRSVTALPTVGECAVHLELLEVFSHLRRRVISTTILNRPFGVPSPQKTVYRRAYRPGYQGSRYDRIPVKLQDLTYPDRSREKWVVFLKIAVVRFLLWAKKIEELMAGRVGPLAEAQLPYLPPLGKVPPTPRGIACRDRTVNL